MKSQPSNPSRLAPPAAAAVPSAGAGARAVAGVAPDVVLVSHGFQTNYERGFSNGVATGPSRVVLVSSDRTDYAGLSPAVTAINLRGSQDENRPRWQKLLNLLRYHLSLLWYLLRNRQAVVHVIGLIEPPLWRGILLGYIFRWMGRKYVLTVHNLLPHDRHTPRNRKLFGWSYRIPDILVVHTPLMKQQLSEIFGIDGSKVVVMTHGIEPIAGSVMESTAARRGAPCELLYFGIVQRYKGIDVLLRALEQVNFEFRLTMIGMCTDGGLRREIEQMIDSHPKREHIQWRCEYVGEAEVPGIFMRADALVMPYRHIDQSGVLFQALRHGVPIVASRVGPLPDYVDASRGELCAPGDADDLARALTRTAGRLTAFDRAGIREGARAYEWPQAARVLDAVYGH